MNNGVSQYIKESIIYIAVIFLTFIVVWYRNGIETALIGLIALSSIFFFLMNAVLSYQKIIKRKINNHLFLNLLGVIIFSGILFLLPQRLSTFSTVLCIVLLVAYIVYDLIVQKLIKKNK